MAVSDASYLAGRSPLELGVLVSLVGLAVAALAGLVAVVDADNVAAGFGTGLGIAVFIFLTGGTIAAGLACLKRGRAELVALGGIVTASLATDLLVLAIWLEIDNEAYGKIAGVAFVWSFFGLLALGLMLAVAAPAGLARALYLGAMVAMVAAGLISTWLVLTAGDEQEVVSDSFSGSPFGVAVGDDALLRALGAALVLLAALWFGTLAASRLERPAGEIDSPFT